jgi:hypothetical protein
MRSGHLKTPGRPDDGTTMTRPTLTLALSSVITAKVEGQRRAGLLAVVRPDHRGTDGGPDATVIPLSRVIPLPTRPRDDEPDPAA